MLDPRIKDADGCAFRNNLACLPGTYQADRIFTFKSIAVAALKQYLCTLPCKIVQEIITANPDQAQQFREGKTKVMGFFVGQLMQKTKGRANPKMANQLFAKELK